MTLVVFDKNAAGPPKAGSFEFIYFAGDVVDLPAATITKLQKDNGAIHTAPTHIFKNATKATADY